MMKRTGLVLALLVALVILPTRLMAQSLDELTQQGNAAWSAKNYTESENIWKKAVLLYPNDARSYYGLGFILAEQKKLEEAIAAYRKAIELDPKYAYAYNGLGNALDDLGKKEEAIAAYRQAIKLQPDDADAYYNMGLALSDQKKLEEAIAAYRKAIELDPKYAYAYNGLGIALSDQKKLEEAIAAYRKAIELDPKLAAAYNNLGNALSDLGKKEEAITAYRKAIELDPKYAYAYNGLGNALDDLGKKEEAIAAYRQAIKLNPDYAAAYNNLGYALDDLGKKEEAIAAYRTALSLPDDEIADPTSSHTLAHNNLGQLYQNQGKLNEAIQEYEAALEIDPKFEYAQNNLKEAQRLLALQQKPAQLIALNETKYLAKDDPLTPIKRSIVKIKIVFPGNAKGASYGTGYVIKRQGNKVWIITNRHVVIDTDTQQEGTNLEIEPYYGEKLPNIPRDRSTAKIIKTTNNDNPDLALLETTALPDDIQPLTLRSSSPDPGLAVTIIGHPNQGDWSEYKTTFMYIHPDTRNLLIAVNLGKGASGSPILDSNLEVIGIMVRSVNESNTNPGAIGIGHPINLVIQQISQWGIKIP